MGKCTNALSWKDLWRDCIVLLNFKDILLCYGRILFPLLLNPFLFNKAEFFVSFLYLCACTRTYDWRSEIKKYRTFHLDSVEQLKKSTKPYNISCGSSRECWYENLWKGAHKKKKIENLWKGVLVYFKINGLFFNWMGKKH